MKDLVEFYYLFYKRVFWGKLSNTIVALHVKFTPDKATDDSLREIILEQLRYRQRRIENIRWNLWEKMEEIGKRRKIKAQEAALDRIMKEEESILDQINEGLDTKD